MLEEAVTDYSAYFKLDLSGGIQTLQDVIDNMLTRLEELTSVLQIIRLRNCDCGSAVTEDINNFRVEITYLLKKVNVVTDIITKLQCNIDILEKRVERAEFDFKVNTDNKIIKNFFKPLLKRNKDTVPPPIAVPAEDLQYQSVLNNFVQSK